MVPTIYSHIKVSLSLITANHRAVAIATTVAQQLNVFYFFFIFLHFSLLILVAGESLDGIWPQLLLPSPRATYMCACSPVYAFKVCSNDCFNYNYAPV